jgi:mRNA interferase RelE/StbE
VNEPAWRVRLAPSARRDIKRLDPPVGERILAALEGLRSQPALGDIKRLAGETPEWRLRVGDWRVRFTRDADERVVVISACCPEAGHTATEPPSSPEFDAL